MMRGSGSALFADPDEYQAFLPVMMSLLVTRPQEFHARLSWMELSELRLLHARETAPRIAHVGLTPERVFVIFPTHRTATLICHGVQLQPGDIVFHSRGERLHQRTTAASSWGALTLTPASLRSYGTILAGQTVAAPRFGEILRPLPADRRQLLRLHAEAVRIIETKLSHLENPEVARAVEQDLIWALVNCLTNAEPQDGSVMRRGYAAMLSQFEAVLDAGLDRPPRVSDICTAIGVSERRLTAGCLRVLGMGPAAYLHQRRLRHGRLTMQHANPGAEGTNEIAQRLGFAGFHDFATAYWNAFGELPHISPGADTDRRA